MGYAVSAMICSEGESRRRHDRVLRCSVVALVHLYAETLGLTAAGVNGLFLKPQPDELTH